MPARRPIRRALAEYEAGPYAGVGEQVHEGVRRASSRRMPTSAAVAEAIVKVVDAPFGKRPFRVHIDPTEDGAEVVFGVVDRVRARCSIGSAFRPASPGRPR